jgi:N-methylhydantoinase A
MRYSGQSYDLTVPFAGDIVAAFHRAHEQRYGYSDRTRTCEVVNIRARFTGRTPKPRLPIIERGSAGTTAAIVTRCNVLFAGRQFAATIYDRSKLKAGNRIAGPAIVTEYSATTFIPPKWTGRVDLHGNILLEAAR